jgi:hypothetical protein
LARITPMRRLFFTKKRLMIRYMFSRIRSLTYRALVLSLFAGTLTAFAVAPAAKAVATNPTPVCSGSTCTITFLGASDFYLWTVPTGITSITVDVKGAAGGLGTQTYTATSKDGGYGAQLTGTVAVTAGSVLRVIAGTRGANGGGSPYPGGGGGGGASLIALNSPATPYVVAGGGGGGPGACCGSADNRGRNASLTTAGTQASPNSRTTSTAGTDGNGGGVAGDNNGGRGGGGAGWLTAGNAGNTGGVAAAALSSGGPGGTYVTNCWGWGPGGRGGYGGGGSACGGGGGGGGGYSGGAGASGSSNWGGGGGGGSYSIATSASSSVLSSFGDGSVAITYLNAPSATTFSSTQSSPTNTTGSISYSIVMSQNVTGMQSSDFENAGTATSCSFSVSAESGTNFTLTVSSCGEGTLIPRLKVNSVFGTVTSSNGPGDATSATTTITIDRTSPTLNSVAAPANGNYYPTQNLNFTAAFSEAVVVSGTPRLTLTIGSTTRYANYFSGSGTNSLVFRYTVASDINDLDSNGIAVGTSVDLNSGTIRDSATNNSSLTYTAPTLTSVLVSQPPSAPTIDSITTSSGTLNINFTAGVDNGATITNYQYQLNGGTWTNRASGTTASPLTITGLTNGTAYTVAIRGISAAGNGTASTTSTAVRVNPPLAISSPGNLTTAYGTAGSITFTASFGTTPYSYSIKRTSDNAQVTGISVVPATGVVTAAVSLLPATYGMTATVTDAVGATSSVNFNVVVSGATLVITAVSPTSPVYGTAVAAASYTTSGLNANDAISSVTYSYRGTGTTSYGPSADRPTAVGTYSITPSAVVFTGGDATAARYSTVTYTAGAFSITKKELTVTPNNADITFGTATPTLTPTITGFAYSDTAANSAGYVAPSCSATSYSRAATVGTTFTITCVGGTANNYSFNIGAPATATMVRAPLAVVADAKSVTYGGNLPSLTFAINGWVNSESAANAAGYSAPTCTTSPSYTTTTAAGSSISITCSGASATNYSFSYTPAALTINKVSTLSITAANQTITYGAATPTNSVTTVGLASGDGISSLTYTYAGTGSTTYAANTQAPTLPGTYSITPSAVVFTGSGSTNNYNTINYTAGSYRINPGRLRITAVSSSTTTYGTTLSGLGFTTVGLGDSAAIGSLTYTYSGAGSTLYSPSTTAPTSLGTYFITPSDAVFSQGNSGYFSSITYVPGFFTITKATATVVPSASSVVYGSATPALGFTLSGLQYSETIGGLAGYTAPTCTTSYQLTTPVASSPIAVTCGGGFSTNYIFTSSTANVLTVTPRAVSVVGSTINDKDWSGTPTAGSINIGTISGLVNGDTYTVTASASNYSSSDAGSYSTTVTYSLGSLSGSDVNNYTVSNSTLTGRINAARVEFTVAPERTAAKSAFSIDYGNSDTLTVSTTTRTIGTVTFMVSVDGADYINIAACPAVPVNPSGGRAVAAICAWSNPTIGELSIRATLTPTDLTANAIEIKEFTVKIVDKPRITDFNVRGKSVDTKIGRVGNVLVITGQNFQGLSAVKFDGVSAPTGSFRATSTQITVTVPAGARTGKITVETEFGGSVTSTETFTVAG